MSAPRSAFAIVAVLLSFSAPARSQTTELAEVQAPGSPSDDLGNSVSLLGDRVLAGAPALFLAATGVAYVFERDAGGAWAQAAKLQSSGSGDAFGVSVSLSVDRALVGAPDEATSQGRRAGSAYIFERQGSGTWVLVARLVASQGMADDRFGTSVALAGDRVLIGSIGDDEAAKDAGAVYVFELQSGAWAEVAKLVALDAGALDAFGTSVSLSGDRALVGATLDDDAGPDSGSAYVFDRATGAWQQEARIAGSTTAAGDLFGSAVFLEADRALVGAPRNDAAGANSGSAYVFEVGPGGAWVEVAELRGADTADGDTFGSSVALSGGCALVGAPKDDDLGNESGAAYVFEEQAGAWTETAKLLPNNGSGGGFFGNGVSLSGDRAAVGNPRRQSTRQGSTYLYDLLPLSSDVDEISLSVGGVQPLAVDAGHLHGGEMYWLVGSASGTSPGIALPGGFVVPLNPDPYLARTLELPNRAPLAHSLGILNAAGHADAAFFILPPDPGLAGVTLHHAFATFDEGGGVTFVSNAFPLVLLP